MNFDLGNFLPGALSIAVAVLGSFVKRSPCTRTMIYLAAGVVIGRAASALRVRMRN